MKSYVFIVFFILILNPLYSKSNIEERVNAERVVVGLIIDNNGLGDDSINDSCYLGLERASNEGLVTIRVKKVTEENSVDDLIDTLVIGSVKIIYIIGESNRYKIILAAEKYKDTTFVGIGIELKESEMRANLYSLSLRSEESGYISGLIAGSMTINYNKNHRSLNEENIVGILLDNNVAIKSIYLEGFKKGIKDINSSCDIVSLYIDNHNDSSEVAEKILEFKESGVDIIYSVSSSADYKLLEHAYNSEILVIGSNWLHRDYIKGPFMQIKESFDIPVYNITKKIVSGEFSKGESISYGLKEDVIIIDKNNDYLNLITDELKSRIDMGIRAIIKKETVKFESLEKSDKSED